MDSILASLYIFWCILIGFTADILVHPDFVHYIFTEITADVLAHLDWVHQIFWCCRSLGTSWMHSLHMWWTTSGFNEMFYCKWLGSLQLFQHILTTFTAYSLMHRNWVNCRCSDALWLSSPWPSNNYSKTSIYHFWGNHGGYKNKGCM